MDFKWLIPTLQAVGVISGNQKITNVLKTYEANRDVIDTLLGALFNRIFNRHPADNTPIVLNPPPIVVQPAPVLVAGGPSFETSHYPQVVDALKVRCYWLEDDRKGGSGGPAIEKALFDAAIVGNGYAHMLNQRMHIDVTPSFRGVEYPGGSPTIRALVREDGHSPCLDLEWFIDGVRASSGEAGQREMDDPLSLESYEDEDRGFTPCFLSVAVQEAKGHVTLNAFLPARYNGGVEVRGACTTKVGGVDQLGWYKD